ncbi:MAG: NB-ARC domain-containing protein [Anditalea sp.]
MKDNLFKELERNQIYPENGFKKYLIEGWEFQDKKYKWIDLICVSFKKELKKSPTLSNIIQTEYLDEIKRLVEGQDIKWTSIEKFLEGIDNQNLSIKSELTRITESIENIEQNFEGLSDKVNFIEDYVKNSHHIVPHNLTLQPFRSNYFIGRDNDLNKIYSHFFKENQSILLINGSGGIGKTTLVSYYFHKYQQIYKHTAWISTGNNLTEALLSLRPALGLKISPDDDTEEEIKKLFLELPRLKNPCLLVIDNANDFDNLNENNQYLQTLSNFHIIITTRISEFRSLKTFHINGLGKDYTILLFKKFFPKLKKDEENLVLEIRNAVDSNTLVMELLAKNLFAINKLNNYSLQELIRDIQSKGLLQLSKQKGVEVDYGNFKKATPSQIIEVIYDITQLSQLERVILSRISLLPTEAIPYIYLEPLLLDISENDKELLSLSLKGWIDFNDDSKSFKCSPVIQEIVRTKNKFLHNDCYPLIMFCIELLDLKKIHNNNYNDSLKYAQFAQSILRYFAPTDSNTCRLLNLMGEFNYTTGNFKKALLFYRSRIKILNEFLHLNPPEPIIIKDIAFTYSNIGDVYYKKGQFNTAFFNFKKEFVLLRNLNKTLIQDKSILDGIARCTARFGDIFLKKNDFKNAIVCYENSLEYTKKVYLSNTSNLKSKNELAIDYSSLGNLNMGLLNYPQAEKYYEKYLELKIDLWKLHPTEPKYINGLSIANERFGECLAKQEKDGALSFLLNANKFSKKLFDDYPSNFDYKIGYSMSCEKVGKFFRDAENFNMALGYYDTHFFIHKELYENDPFHQDIARELFTAYQNKNDVFYRLGQWDELIDHNDNHIGLLKVLIKNFPNQTNFKESLGLVYYQFGFAQEKKKLYLLAKDSYIAGIEQLDSIISNKKSSNTTLELLGASNFNLAEICFRIPVENPNALKYFKSAKVMFEKLMQLEPNNSRFNQMVNQIEGKIKKI